jgi:antitoxin CptB
MPEVQPAMGALRWRSRRGMKELDVLLERWLDNHHAAASSAEKHAFEHLLGLPDPELADYLVRGATPPRQFVAIVRTLRGATD